MVAACRPASSERGPKARPGRRLRPTRPGRWWPPREPQWAGDGEATGVSMTEPRRPWSGDPKTVYRTRPLSRAPRPARSVVKARGAWTTVGSVVGSAVDTAARLVVSRGRPRSDRGGMHEP